MLSLGVLAGRCLPLFSMLQTRLHKQWELTHVNCTLPMSIPLQNLPGSVHFLKPSGSLSFFFFLFFFVFCPQSTTVMCKKLGLSKVDPPYWKQNSTFVSLFLCGRERGVERDMRGLMHFCWPVSGQLTCMWGNSLTLLESTVIWHITSLFSSRVHLHIIITNIFCLSSTIL